MNMRENDIAVIGVGGVFPGALDVDQYWSNMVNGVDSISSVPEDRLNGGLNFQPPFMPELEAMHIRCSRGGFVPQGFRFDPLRYGVLPKNVGDGDPDQFFAMAIIDAALHDADIQEDDPLRETCDVIIGRGGYLTNKMSEGYLYVDLFPHLLAYHRRDFAHWTDAEFAEFARRLCQHLPVNAGPDSTTTSMPNLVASRAANRLNLRGAAYTVDGACASSLLSVEHAVLRLRARRCDVAIAAGVQLVQLPTFWYVFQQLGAMSKSGVVRPFDRRADGLLIGEGGGAAVLKRLADAQRDGDRVYAVIKGVGTSSDGRGAAILTPSSDGQVLALQRAYRDGDIEPDSIGYLEGHGTATEIGDPVELRSIKRFYGERRDMLPRLALGSVKSMIGHLMAGAGIAAFIRTVLALSNKVLPPSLNCEEPHPELEGSMFYLNARARPWIHSPSRAPRRAGVNAFGFGGINVHVVLEEVSEEAGSTLLPRPLVCPANRPTELFAWAADSPAEMVPLLIRLASAIDDASHPTLAELSAAVLREVDASKRCKLAMVCADIDDLRDRLTVCLDRLQQAVPDFSGEKRVFFAEAAATSPGRVAAVFPGMSFPGIGGAYAEHLVTLCLHFPELRRVFDTADARDDHPADPVPTNLLFSPPETLPEATRESLRNRIMTPPLSVLRVGMEAHPPAQRNFALAALPIANWAGWTLLQTLGVPCDCVVGQSLGEFAARCAAGIVAYDELMSGLWIGLAAIPPYEGDGQLAFVAASEQQLAPFLSAAPDTHIALHIAPRVQVLGGPAAELERLATALSAQGIIVQILPFPPLHTEHSGYLQTVLDRAMEAGYTRFHAAQIPIYSCVTERQYPSDKEQIRAMAADVLTRPVRYWQTLRHMYDEGVRVFIETGSGGLNATLKTAMPEAAAVMVALNQDDVDPLTQIHDVCATLFTAGVRLDLAALHGRRRLRQLDLGAPALGLLLDTNRMLLPLRMDILPFGRKAFEEGRRLLSVIEPETALERATSPARDDAEVTADDEGQLELRHFPGLPFLGEVLEFVPKRRIVMERILDLDRDLFLRDHVYIQVQDYKPIEECMPLFPMAAMVETMAEAAQCLVPELGVIRVEQMRALRWIALIDQTTLPVRIEATVESIDERTGAVAVRTRLASAGQPNATALVVLGAACEETVELRFSPRDGSRTWLYTAEEIYRDRHAFHGPRLQCVTQSGPTGSRGGDTWITVLPVDAWFLDDPQPRMLLDIASLDGVAQILGMWARGYGKYVLPMGFQKLELYGPTPPPGTSCLVRIEMTGGDETSRAFVFDIEVLDGQGAAWMRLKSFTMWAMGWTSRGIDAQRQWERLCLARRCQFPELPADAVVTCLSDEELPGGNSDWICRASLTHAEIERFNSIESPRHRWQWLFGRLAAKDAVRMWMREQYGTLLPHPLSFAILDDERGRPYVQPAGDLPDPPQVSISHCGGRSYAAAAACPIGIDAEPANRSVYDILPHFADEEERQALAALGAQSNSPLRLWCAKEAVGKALGTGLDGAPRHFQAVDADADGRILIFHHPSAEHYVVGTDLDDGYLVAWALAEPVATTEKSPGVEPNDCEGRDEVLSR